MYDSEDEILEHIKQVRRLLTPIANQINFRALTHDASKLHDPEKPIFDKYTPLLKETEYMSEEYKQQLSEMSIALSHHYTVNSHHVEHFYNGIKGMTLVDLIEMLADWKVAASQYNGHIIDSIEKGQERFGYSDELKEILLNTVREYLT